MVADRNNPDTKLASVISCLVDLYAPDRIFLFGSKARGDDTVDSDYDLMVIVPDDALPERRNGGRAYEHLWKIGASADVLVWTQSSFDKRAHVVSSLPATILREGQLLYAVRS